MDDFDTLAQEFGGAAAEAAPPPAPAPAGAPDLDALATQMGGQTAAPAPAPAPRVMQPNEFEFQVEQALRRGADPAAIQETFGGIINSQTGGPIAFPKPEELTAAADYYRRGGTEPLKWNREILGPDGTPSSNVGSYVRGIADRATLNFADELEAFVETGSFSGEDFDAALTRRQQRRLADNPDFRSAGEFVGTGLTMAVPGGAASRVAGMGRQMLTGSLLGGSMAAASGIGQGSGETRFDNVGEDFTGGAVAGLAAPVVAGVGRKLVQTLVPGGAVDQTLSDDILQSAGLSADELRRRAADYFAATGRGARITDLLTPDEAQRFTRPLSRSDEARNRVLGEVEAARTELPAALSARTTNGGVVAGPEEIRRQANDLADREFGAIADRAVNLDEFGRTYMLENVMPYVNLPKMTRDNIARALKQGGTLTVADLDMVRRALNKTGGTNLGGVPYERVANDIQDYITDQVPEYGQAVANMARRLSVADGGDPRFLGGADLGRAAVGNASTTDVLTGINRQSPEGRVGVELGVRSGLFDSAVESPGKSYALAKRLEEDPGFQERLRASLPPGEADDLIAFASAQKQGVDAIAAMARIPQDKIETLLDSTEEMTDAIVAAGLGAGGAFKAGIINSILARTNIGEGAANKLAEDLLNPARRERVLDLLEKAGLPKLGVREIVQGAFIAAGVQLATANREPEGVPAPTETVTMGVPQQ